MYIGKRLRELRESKGLSQGDIQERTGISRCYVSRIECGGAVPCLEKLEKWGNVLGVTLSDIFTKDATGPKHPQTGQLTFQEKQFLGLLRLLDEADRRLLLSIADNMEIHRASDSETK